jgi:hypothetical protein
MAKNVVGSALAGAGTGAAAGSVAGPWGALIGGAVGAIGGAWAGNAAGKHDEDDARRAQQDAIDAQKRAAAIYDQIVADFGTLTPPTPEQLKTKLEEYKQQGIIAQEDIEGVMIGASQLQKVQVDPRLRLAQTQALEKLAQAGEGGLTPTERFAIQQARQEAERSATSQQQSTLQNMQQRGVGGAGAELAARMASTEAASGRLNDASMQQAAQANKLALEAMVRRGEMASSMEGKQWTQDTQKAQASDEIAKFNSLQRAQGQARNTSIAHYNAKSAADINNKNTELRNITTQQQRQDMIDYYDRQKAIMAAKANAMVGKAGALGNISTGNKDYSKYLSGQATDTQNRWATGGQGLGTAAGTVGQMGYEAYNKEPPEDTKEESWGENPITSATSYDDYLEQQKKKKNNPPLA